MHAQMIIETLHKIATAERAKATTNLNIYLSNSVGVGEHSTIIEEADKLVADISAANGKIEVLEKMISKINEEIAASKSKA